MILDNDVVTNIRHVIGVDSIDAALVLGSGWAPLVSTWPKATASCTYDSVGLLPPAAPGHAGELLLFEHEGLRILVFSGRTHLYEGHGAQAVTLNVRVASALGAEVILFTNANGSLVPHWPLGQIVALSDHLNLTGISPLTGADFVDLTNAYDLSLRELMIEEAAKDAIKVEQGVYAMFPGPHYETAAEARAAKILGAHLVGMSTVLETIAAREKKMKVVALSAVTAHEASGEVIDPEKVISICEANAGRIGPAVLRLLSTIRKGQ